MSDAEAGTRETRTDGNPSASASSTHRRKLVTETTLRSAASTSSAAILPRTLHRRHSAAASPPHAHPPRTSDGLLASLSPRNRSSVASLRRRPSADAHPLVPETKSASITGARRLLFPSRSTALPTAALYGSALYSALQLCPLQRSTALPSTALYSSALYSALQLCPLQRSTALLSTALYSSALYSALQLPVGLVTSPLCISRPCPCPCHVCASRPCICLSDLRPCLSPLLVSLISVLFVLLCLCLSHHRLLCPLHHTTASRPTSVSSTPTRPSSEPYHAARNVSRQIGRRPQGRAATRVPSVQPSRRAQKSHQIVRRPLASHRLRLDPC
jgi:hypothetical protein